MSLSLKKSRIDEIMEKIIGNIKDTNLNENARIVRHSLSLLKFIFELVKEEEKYYALSPSN